MAKKDSRTKKVIELAGKLAVAAMKNGAYSTFEAPALAEYCLELSNSIVYYVPDEDDDDDEDDD